MDPTEPLDVTAAEVVLSCPALDETLAFFTERLGFRLEVVSPADDPSSAVITGHGLRLRLERGPEETPAVLRLLCSDPGAMREQELLGPHGLRIQFVNADPPLRIPLLVPSFVVSRANESAAWKTGRAGMLYRDLIPGRQGGRFIASHIRIPEGGPVPDYVHYHEVLFQMIYCAKGWVRVVYEDQGLPFVLQAGDCVLQPPGIRHRVLDCSPGLEVIEIACPAAHETRVDHDLALPTTTARPDRDFTGQRFLRHEAAGTTWGPWRLMGFEARDLGVAKASKGIGGACVVRLVTAPMPRVLRHDGELFFLFVLSGSVTLEHDGKSHELGEGDSVVVPGKEPFEVTGCSHDLELLEVTVPASAT